MKPFGPPSGWALLDGASATTQSLKTDDELIVATIAANPALISIDTHLFKENF